MEERLRRDSMFWKFDFRLWSVMTAFGKDTRGMRAPCGSTDCNMQECAETVDQSRFRACDGVGVCSIDQQPVNVLLRLQNCSSRTTARISRIS
jgi:hypothetical protein